MVVLRSADAARSAENGRFNSFKLVPVPPRQKIDETNQMKFCFCPN